MAPEPPPRTNRSPRAPGRDERIVRGRGARQSGEQRGLTQREPPGRRVEVQRGGGIDADRPLPERHAVQVLLEDRLLRQMRLEPQRPERSEENTSELQSWLHLVCHL